MTSRERILAAMRGDMPDMVPVQLGVTNMFSVLQQGYTGWDIYLDKKAPLYRVVVDTQRRFGLDAYIYAGVSARGKHPQVVYEHKEVRRDERTAVIGTRVRTPEGDLYSESTYMKNETPTTTQGFIKNEADFDLWLKYCVRDDEDYGCDALEEMRAYLGEDGVIGGTVSGVPGLHNLMGCFEGKLENATYFLWDEPERFAAYVEKVEKRMLRELEAALTLPFDYIQFSNSGMLTLSTPEIYRKWSLPTLRKAGRICAQAGVLSELHCCGNARMVVEDIATTTEIDCINPLQPPPMGDCDLAELKSLFGDRICLKGNVGVTSPLLFGTPQDMEADVSRCMDAAKEGGRYILFSEEGIGAETPVENVEAYVRAGRALGRY